MGTFELLKQIDELEKKNTILEAENLQLWERIRALEKKIGIYAPGIKDPAHEAERGE